MVANPEDGRKAGLNKNKSGNNMRWTSRSASSRVSEELTRTGSAGGGSEDALEPVPKIGTYVPGQGWGVTKTMSVRIGDERHESLQGKEAKEGGFM